MTPTSTMLLLLITVFRAATAGRSDFSLTSLYHFSKSNEGNFTAKDCPPLASRSNSYISYGTSMNWDGSYTSGTMARLRCFSGYYTTGEIRISINKNARTIGYQSAYRIHGGTYVSY